MWRGYMIVSGVVVCNINMQRQSNPCCSTSINFTKTFMNNKKEMDQNSREDISPSTKSALKIDWSHFAVASRLSIVLITLSIILSVVRDSHARLLDTSVSCDQVSLALSFPIKLVFRSSYIWNWTWHCYKMVNITFYFSEQLHFISELRHPLSRHCVQRRGIPQLRLCEIFNENFSYDK